MARTDPNVEAIKEIQKWLDRLNEEEVSDTSEAEYVELSRQIDELLQKQEIYWAQWSRVSWLKHGDKNTKKFHSKATQRRRKNHIKGIKNAQGQWVEEIENVVAVASDYFHTLFHASAGDQMEKCLDAVPSRVTEDMLMVLSSESTAEEVKVALFQMGPIKAPGPDGMNAFFYKIFWHIVGDDVVFAVLDFFK